MPLASYVLCRDEDYYCECTRVNGMHSGYDDARATTRSHTVVVANGYPSFVQIHSHWTIFNVAFSRSKAAINTSIQQKRFCVVGCLPVISTTCAITVWKWSAGLFAALIWKWFCCCFHNRNVNPTASGVIGRGKLANIGCSVHVTRTEQSLFILCNNNNLNFICVSDEYEKRDSEIDRQTDRRSDHCDVIEFCHFVQNVWNWLCCAMHEKSGGCWKSFSSQY